MPSQGFEDLINRAISDESFALQLRNDPDGAMSAFDLTGDERDALRSRDPAKLQALGLDERISRRRGAPGAAGPWSISSDAEAERLQDDEDR
jgi:hypothetical protein